jgi:glycosyltransferase involved in cell wall biosynthesis
MVKNWIGEPLVSVIIPTYNSDRFLALCLDSIRRQTWKKVEIIVVDDGSTDGTLRIAEKYGCIVASNTKKGRAEAKNEGALLSRGEYLFFIDSDMELSQNTISTCIHLSRETSSFGGVVVPEHSVGESYWVKVRDFERSFYFDSVIESARFFPAKLVKEVGGFEEGLVFFEESTLPYKIQARGIFLFPRTDPLIFHHEEEFSLATWFKKKFYYGETIHLYSNKYGDYSKMQTNMMFRLSLFTRDWRRLFGKPNLALGLFFLKSLEYVAATSGQVCSRI